MGDRLTRRGYHPEHLKAESFTQLLVLTIDAVVKEPSREKRQMCARILAQVTEGDLRVLKAVMKVFRAIDATAPDNLPEEKHRKLYRVSVDDVGRHLADGQAPSAMARNVYLKRLARLGLLIEAPLMDRDVDTGNDNPTHIMEDLMQLVFVQAH